MNASTRVPAAEITGFTGGLMKMASRKMIGQVPDSLGVLWHHRRVLQDLMGVHHVPPPVELEQVADLEGHAGVVAPRLVDHRG